MTLSLLKKIPLIRDVREVTFDTVARDILDKQKVETAKQRSRQVRVYRILYQSKGHSVVGFVVEPRKPAKKFPCVIYNRGGSGNFGKIGPEQLFLHLARIASWGYLVITTQYSGNDGGEGKDEMGGDDIEDVLMLYKILKGYPRADISRIGMYGASRGGMMTYLCLARVHWLRAAVCVAGLADLFRQEKLRPEMKGHFKKMFGGKREDLRKRSAIHWVDTLNKKTPVLLLHGSADWRVSPLDSIEMSKEMVRENVPHRLVLLEGADHRLSEFRELRFEMIQEWLDRFVRDKEKLPNLKPHGA